MYPQYKFFTVLSPWDAARNKRGKIPIFVEIKIAILNGYSLLEK